jgi:hypothetical protein
MPLVQTERLGRIDSRVWYGAARAYDRTLNSTAQRPGRYDGLQQMRVHKISRQKPDIAMAQHESVEWLKEPTSMCKSTR